MNWNIVYYIFAIAGVLLFALSVQPKKKHNILRIQILASICYFMAYLVKGLFFGVVGAYSAVATEIIEQIKDLVFIKYEKRNKKIPLRYLFIFSGLLVLTALIFLLFITKEGWIFLLPLLINICYFIGTYIHNPKVIRIIVLCCAVLWAIYNYSVGAYIIIVGNGIEIISAIIALKRHKK